MAKLKLWQKVGAVLTAAIEERYARLEAARLELAHAERLHAVLGEAARVVQDEDDGFVQLGVTTRELDEVSAASLQEQALQYALTNPHAIGYLASLHRFVMGRGPSIRCALDDKALAAACDAQWEMVARANNWEDLEDELVGRLWRDGEVFLRGIVQPIDGALPGYGIDPQVAQTLERYGVDLTQLSPPNVPAGLLVLRLLPPDQIRDPSGVISHGIITAARDVQAVLGYVWAPDNAAPTVLRNYRIADRVGDEVLHWKIRVDADIKRGRSILEPILQGAAQYQQWLKYRIMLNLMRTSVVLIKQIKGSPSQVAALRDAQERTRDTGTGRQLKMLRPGTTIHATDSIDYRFEAPNIHAPDAKDDGRAILLQLAAATGLPEYMFTGDASNANYASTIVAEAPAVREFEAWQDRLTPLFVTVYRWAMRAAAQYGAIPLSADEAATVPVAVEWPPVLPRNEELDVEVKHREYADGVRSRESYARARGLDWEREQQQMAAEAGTQLAPQVARELLPALANLVSSGALSADANLEARLRAWLGLPPAIADIPMPDVPAE